MNTDIPDLQNASIRQLQHGLKAGQFTSLDLVKAYVARIEEVNHVLNAVISVSPAAFEAARALDEERRQGKMRSPLHGIPIAIKDNIATRTEDGMDTTAGSFALQGAQVPGDADCVRKLREAGAIILCKTNLCEHPARRRNLAQLADANIDKAEWANFRGVGTSSWSPVGGQCTSPYYPAGDCSGSSSGSAVATAVGLAAASLGTETGGSMHCNAGAHNVHAFHLAELDFYIDPAGFCAGVAIRSTLGAVSSEGVVPLTPQRDTVGPMTRTVEDACLVLEAISGLTDRYAPSLHSGDLSGLRLLAPTNLTDWQGKPLLNYGQQESLRASFNVLRRLGADVVEAPVAEDFVDLDRDEEAFNHPMEIEFVAAIREYLVSLRHIPSGVQSVEDLLQHIEDDPRERPGYYDTARLFESCLSRESLESETYRRLKARVDQSKKLIETELKEHNAHAVIQLAGTGRMWSHAAYPQVTVPLGLIGNGVPIIPYQIIDRQGQSMDDPLPVLSMHPNKPFGITFSGAANSEATLIRIAHCFEQATQQRSKCKTYFEATPKTQLKDVV